LESTQQNGDDLGMDIGIEILVDRSAMFIDKKKKNGST
jgi:hypothetical protein